MRIIKAMNRLMRAKFCEQFRTMHKCGHDRPGNSNGNLFLVGLNVFTATIFNDSQLQNIFFYYKINKLLKTMCETLNRTSHVSEHLVAVWPL